MAIVKPNLTAAQPGAPITAADWNAMIRAVRELQTTLQTLRTRAPSGILVTVRDRDSEAILPPTAIAAVYAVSLSSNTLMQPGQRATSGDQAYLIPIDAPGDYEVTVEPTPDSGYQQQTQRVTVGEQIALVDFLLWEQPREPVVPLVFGKTLREARALLEAAGVPVRRMLDAHGQVIDDETWEASYGNRLVIGTEPGAGMVVSGADAVDILVAGRVEPTERRPVLVGQVAVARPTRLALSPDGRFLYALGQGSERGGNTSITVIDTRRRRVAATIDTGSTPLLNLVFAPDGARAFAAVILPEFSLSSSLSRLTVATELPQLRIDQPIGPRGIEAAGTSTTRAFSADLLSGAGRINLSSAATSSAATSAAATSAAANISLGSQAATSVNAISAAAMLGRGGALNQLVTEAGTGAAFSAGIASLAAVNLAAALGSGVKARGNQGAIVAIDAARHQMISGAIIPAAVCYGLDITADGRYLYGTSPTQRRLIRVDLRANQITERAWEGIPAFVDVVGDTAYVTDVSRNLLWRLAPDADDRSFPAGLSPQDLAVSPDGRFAYIINSNVQTGSLVRVDLTQQEVAPETIPGVSPRATTQDGYILSGIDITADGRRLCVAVDEGLAIINTQTLAVQTVNLGGQPAGVVVEQATPADEGEEGPAFAGKYAYVANFSDNVVQIVDLTGQDEPFVRTSITGALFTGRIAELMTVPGINEHIAERLVLSGIQSVNDLANANTKLVAGAIEVNETQATAIIGRASRLSLTVR